LATKYLRRHPCEVGLSPEVYDELAALEDLENPNMCPRCREQWLETQRRKVCEFCGKEYTDEQVVKQLNTGT